MTLRKTPQDEIDRFKKRQRQVRVFAGGAIVILVLAGIALIVLSLTSAATPAPTATPLPTATVPTKAPTLTVPLPTDTVIPTATVTPTLTASATAIGPFEYTVQEKDNCWDLAIKFKVDLAAMLAINNFAPGTCPINPGSKIMIPAPGQALPTPTPIDVSKMLAGTVINYTVQLGDSLRQIAITFHSTQDDILKMNPTVTDANAINAGQVLKIRVNIATPVPTLGPTSTPGTKTITPTVGLITWTPTPTKKP
jgi:LysM repeat protein